MRRAVKAARTTSRTVRKYAKPAVRKSRRKFRAKTFDRIPRTLRFLTPPGIISVTVRDSRVASDIARYWNGVNDFLKSGALDRLAEFRGKSFRTGRTRHRYITDPLLLSRLAYVGQVSFEDIYALTS